tara:strand:+ start:155 stop:676 length:522 start_codon:yes stop_codon:yes gene_type:complete
MRDKEIKEGLADLAQRAEMDHEVQMARSDLYKIAKYAIKLHDMLKNVSEAEGLEGWKQSKITKAADYLSSVFHAMDYDMQFGEQKESIESPDYKENLINQLAEKKNLKTTYQTLEESVGKEITEDEFDRLAEKKDACYHKVKARYKVWPSAYASGALVQCRKKGAKNWGNKSK